MSDRRRTRARLDAWIRCFRSAEEAHRIQGIGLERTRQQIADAEREWQAGAARPDPDQRGDGSGRPVRELFEEREGGD